MQPAAFVEVLSFNGSDNTQTSTETVVAFFASVAREEGWDPGGELGA